MLNITIVGASGRMGQSILSLARDMESVQIVGAVVRPGSSVENQPVPGWDALRYSSDLDAAVSAADVVLDFSAPGPRDRLAKACAEHGRALLVGTTGLDAEAQAQLKAQADRIPVLLAPNTSLGVNQLVDLVRRTAAALGEQYDIEILEAHHGRKQDAPSGTALRLGDAAADGRGQSLESVAVHARQGQTGPREPGAIGFSVVRGGDIAGEHTVMFAGPGERIELTHRASSRDTFARGALDAARWLASGRAPGLYGMNDVLGA